MGRIAVVVHEEKVAGLGDGDPCQLLRAAVEARGWPEPVFYPTSSSDAGADITRTALAEGAELVVVCGGDGTLNACAEALNGSGVPMAVIPVGTGNLIAGNLGVPQDPATAVATAVSGTDRDLDLGQTPEGVVVGMAGVGLDAAMVQDAPRWLKRRVGWPAYAVSLFRHLADRGFTAVVEVDGEKVTYPHARTVVIGNVGALHGGLNLFPDARPDDGVLEVAVLAPRTVLGWIPTAARLLAKRKGSIPVRKGKHIIVTADRTLRRETDGEALPDGRVMEVTVAPGALRLRL